MSFVDKNFSKTRLTRVFQEVGGEKQSVEVTRYTYESAQTLYDLDILDRPIIICGKQLKSVFSVNGQGVCYKFVSYQGPRKGMVEEVETAADFEYSYNKTTLNFIIKYFDL